MEARSWSIEAHATRVLPSNQRPFFPPIQLQVRKLSKAMADELAQAGTIAEERVANIRAVRALGNDALEVAR